MARAPRRDPRADKRHQAHPRHDRRTDARPSRRRLRNRRRAAVRGRRQPRTAQHRRQLRRALRIVTRRDLFRQDETTPPQPCRRPPRQRRALDHRHGPHPQQPRTHHRLHRTTHRPKASPNEKPSAASNATSPARSTTTSAPSPPPSTNHKSQLDPKRRIRSVRGRAVVTTPCSWSWVFPEASRSLDRISGCVRVSVSRCQVLDLVDVYVRCACAGAHRDKGDVGDDLAELVGVGKKP